MKCLGSGNGTHSLLALSLGNINLNRESSIQSQTKIFLPCLRGSMPFLGSWLEFGYAQQLDFPHQLDLLSQCKHSREHLLQISNGHRSWRPKIRIHQLKFEKKIDFFFNLYQERHLLSSNAYL